MSSSVVDLPQHPVVEFAERLSRRLDGVSEVPLMSMAPEQKRSTLLSLARSRAQLEALQLRLLAEAEQSEATVDTGARSAADWVAIETRQVRRDARSDLHLAEKLEGHEVLSEAMGRGCVNVGQARAIMAALDKLPPHRRVRRERRAARSRGGPPR